MPDVGVAGGAGRGMETANHHDMYVPMQQSCRMQDVHIYLQSQSTIKINLETTDAGKYVEK